MGSQYHASIEIDLSSSQQNKDYSKDICDAFLDGKTYSHSATLSNMGKYSLDFFGNGYSDGHTIKRYCAKLAKTIGVNAFSLIGTLNNEGSGGGFLDAVRAVFKSGRLVFEYWQDCNFGNDQDLDRLSPSIYDTVRIDSTYLINCDGIVNFPYIDDKAAIEEIIVTGEATEIGFGAFRAFHNLKRVELPDTIKYLSINAFVNCEKLSQVNTPKSLKVGYDTSIVNCPCLKLNYPKEYVIIKPEGCAEFKEKLFDLISRLDNEHYELDYLFELLLSSNEVDKAVAKIFKDGGTPSSGLFGAIVNLSECFAAINEKAQVEQTINALFSSKTIEKMKTRYAIMIGLMKGMNPDDICKETGANASAVSSVSRILNQSGWKSVKWFYTYCLQNAQ